MSRHPRDWGLLLAMKVHALVALLSDQPSYPITPTHKPNRNSLPPITLLNLPPTSLHPAQAKDCSDRLSLAERLTTGLATEKDRWAQTVREMRLGSVTIAGDVMLAAAFTCYIGKWEKGKKEGRVK